jgi:hypothetical protein
LVAGPRWVPDTKTDWPTDCRSYYNFDFDSFLKIVVTNWTNTAYGNLVPRGQEE